MAETMRYEVRPTGPTATDQHTDISMSGLFNAYVAIINGEKQAIWQRYSIMLLANAIIFGFLTRAAGISGREVAFGSFLGLGLCLAWFVIMYRGWIIFRRWSTVAARFFWPALDDEINPFYVFDQTVTGWTYRMSLFIIGLFTAGYIFLPLNYLYAH